MAASLSSVRELKNIRSLVPQWVDIHIAASGGFEMAASVFLCHPGECEESFQGRIQEIQTEQLAIGNEMDLSK